MSDLHLVLASASPRRRELLERLTLAFTVEPTDVDESVVGNETPAQYVQRLALAKATAGCVPATLTIGCDTAVVVDGDILGKPADRAEAAAMLQRLSGRAHEAMTGVAVAVTDADGEQTAIADFATTTVTVEAMGPDRIDWYLGTGEAEDKAGAYALQGAAALFADRVEGSVTNVIGLPLPVLDRLCRVVGVDLLSFRIRR